MSKMFDQIAATVQRAPRVQLDELARQLWRSHGAGLLDDGQAQGLAELIQARRACPVAPARPAGSVRSRAGSRPRSPEHRLRRMRWVASGWLPPAVAARFTPSHVAVLAVIAGQVARKGFCELCNAALANLAGVSVSTVKAAKREAVAAGVLSVELRRVSGWRNRPNLVRIVSPEWSSWLRLRGRGGGVKSPPGFEYEGKKGQSGLQFRSQNGRPGASGRAAKSLGWRSEASPGDGKSSGAALARFF